MLQWYGLGFFSVGVTENLETNKRLALCKHHFLPTDFVDEKKSLLRFGVVPHSHKSVEVVHTPTTAAPSTRKRTRTLNLFEIDTDVHAPVIPIKVHMRFCPLLLSSAPSHTPTSISGSPVKVFDDSDRTYSIIWAYILHLSWWFILFQIVVQHFIHRMIVYYLEIYIIHAATPTLGQTKGYSSMYFRVFVQVILKGSNLQCYTCCRTVARNKKVSVAKTVYWELKTGSAYYSRIHTLLHLNDRQECKHRRVDPECKL